MWFWIEERKPINNAIIILSKRKKIVPLFVDIGIIK